MDKWKSNYKDWQKVNLYIIRCVIQYHFFSRSVLTLVLILLPIVDLGYMIDENTKGQGI